jgi:hypothetical protein
MWWSFLVFFLEFLSPLYILILYSIKLYILLLLNLNWECISQFSFIILAIWITVKKGASIIGEGLVLDLVFWNFLSLETYMGSWEVNIGLRILVKFFICYMYLQKLLIFWANLMFFWWILNFSRSSEISDLNSLCAWSLYSSLVIGLVII